jgi:hypothetical protein
VGLSRRARRGEKEISAPLEQSLRGSVTSNVAANNHDDNDDDDDGIGW